MIEMLGVLAIIGVLSAGGIMGYSAAMENYRVNKTIEDMQNALANARYFFTGKTSIHLFDVDKLKRLKLMPENYKNLGEGCWGARNCVQTPIGVSQWGFEYSTSSPNWADKGIIMPAANMWVKFEGLSESQCVKMVTAVDWSSMTNFTFISFYTQLTKKIYIRATRKITPNEAKSYCEGTTQIVFSMFFKGRLAGAG